MPEAHGAPRSPVRLPKPDVQSRIRIRGDGSVVPHNASDETTAVCFMAMIYRREDAAIVVLKQMPLANGSTPLPLKWVWRRALQLGTQTLSPSMPVYSYIVSTNKGQTTAYRVEAGSATPSRQEDIDLKSLASLVEPKVNHRGNSCGTDARHI